MTFSAMNISNGSVSTVNPAGGILLTVTPPTGQRVRLTHLSTKTGVIRERMTIIFGVTEIIADKPLYGQFPAGTEHWSIGAWNNYSTPPNGNHQYVTGKTDEVCYIKTESTIEAGTVYYTWQTGV